MPCRQLTCYGLNQASEEILHDHSRKDAPLVLTKEQVGGKRLDPFLLIFMNIKLVDQQGSYAVRADEGVSVE